MNVSGFLRINRFGLVETKKQSDNQCKEHGHRNYEYQISMSCCSTNVDENDFVVEHAVLHEMVEKIFKKKISSCENMAKTVAAAVIEEMQKHNLHIVDLYIKLQPVLDKPSKNYAFMEYSMSGNFL